MAKKKKKGLNGQQIVAIILLALMLFSTIASLFLM